MTTQDAQVKNKGFTLLYSVLVISIVLSVGLVITDIVFKELILSSTIRESQRAFYAADAAIECALYWDQKHTGFSGSVFGYLDSSASISPNHLTTGFTPGFRITSANTAPISPSSNALVLAWVASTRYAQDGDPSPPTLLSGNGLTWRQVSTRLYDSVGTGFSPRSRITLFRAMKTSPTAGAVNISFGTEVQNEIVWSIVEFKNVDTSGTDGSGAIAQFTSTIINSTSITANLAAFVNADNRPAMGVSHGNLGVITPESGYTKFAQAGDGAGATEISIMSEWKSDGEETTPSASWATSDRAGAIAVELNAPSDQFVPPIPAGTPNVKCIGALITAVSSGWNINSSGAPDRYVTKFDLNFSDGTCAKVTAVKDKNAGTSIDARGYNTCNTNNPRRVERGLRALY